MTMEIITMVVGGVTAVSIVGVFFRQYYQAKYAIKAPCMSIFNRIQKDVDALRKKQDELENKTAKHDRQIAVIMTQIKAISDNTDEILKIMRRK